MLKVREGAEMKPGLSLVDWKRAMRSALDSSVKEVDEDYPLGHRWRRIHG